MSDPFLRTVVSRKPQGYEPLSFPSLYWPFPDSGTQVRYLYTAREMWKFTLFWTLISIVGVHMVVALYAVVVQHRNWKIIWFVPAVYLVIGGIEGLIAGNVVGGLLGGVYSAGSFRMSTWIPFSWGLINAMLLIISSFAIQGGL